MTWRIEAIWDWFWNAFWMAFAALALLLGTGTAIVSITADGRVLDCYVESERVSSGWTAVVQYQLRGRRSWRPDTTLYVSTSFEDVVQRAELVRCPLDVGEPSK